MPLPVECRISLAFVSSSVRSPLSMELWTAPDGSSVVVEGVERVIELVLVAVNKTNGLTAERIEGSGVPAARIRGVQSRFGRMCLEGALLDLSIRHRPEPLVLTVGSAQFTVTAMDRPTLTEVCLALFPNAPERTATLPLSERDGPYRDLPPIAIDEQRRLATLGPIDTSGFGDQVRQSIVNLIDSLIEINFDARDLKTYFGGVTPAELPPLRQQWSTVAAMSWWDILSTWGLVIGPGSLRSGPPAHPALPASADLAAAEEMLKPFWYEHRARHNSSPWQDE
jgi:hypothetical protein